MRRLGIDLLRVAATVQGWLVFVLGCLVWGVLVLPLMFLVALVWPGARERVNDLTRLALYVYIRTLPFARFRVEGARRAQPGAQMGARIVIANHQSWLDPIVMIGHEPRLAGPARSYLFRVPILRSILRLAGFFESDIGELASLDQLGRAAEAAGQRGGALLFFPEGTRSRTGEIGPFHRGAFRVAVDHALPIQPVVIEGLDRVLPPGHLFVQTPGRQLVRIRYLDPIEPPFGSGVRRDVVRTLAERVRAILAEELARLRAERTGSAAVGGTGSGVSRSADSSAP